jgi:type IV secretory pathway TraG/TraD family ATPase VirD4
MAQQRARGRDRGLDWALLAEKMLKYLLHAAALEHLDGSRAADPQRPVGMARVVQWAASERLTAAADILRTSPQASRWAELVEDMSRSAPETFYSIKINLHEALACWEDPGILARMAPGRSPLGDLDPAALVRNSDRLMVIARPSGHAIPLVTSLVSAVVEAGRQEARRALAQGGRLDPPLLLLLDEVCKVCPLPQLPELVTDCASQGIVVVYALQSLEDGRTAWGPTRFGGMWSATNCHLVMGQVSSAETLRDLSDLSPTVRIEDPREARNARGERLDPVVRYERALTTDELAALPALSGIAFYGRRPMRLDMPHVASPQSEVQAQALASKAAWLRWVTEHQSPQAMGRGGDEED